jgi:hypothetical protein
LYGFETWSLIIREEHMLRVLGAGCCGDYEGGSDEAGVNFIMRGYFS